MNDESSHLQLTPMTRVGNHTNNPDPLAINSRLFVGNLNTYAVTKEELGRMFQRYGSVIGISMHKGYAFVQFTDTWDARNAVMGEDGRTLAGQVLDVNMVSEPKPHQIIRKRQVTSSNASVSSRSSGVPAQKRARPDKVTKSKVKSALSASGRPYAFSDADILICGNCKELFQGIQSYFEHKKQSCKLRFSCKCQKGDSTPEAPLSPICMRCEAKFPTWWDLVQHMETEHSLAIYRKPEETVTNPTAHGDGDHELSDTVSEEIREGSTNSWDSHSTDGDVIWTIPSAYRNGDGNSEENEENSFVIPSSNVINPISCKEFKDEASSPRQPEETVTTSTAEKAVGTDDLI